MKTTAQQIKILNDACGGELHGGEEYGWLCKPAETTETIKEFVEASSGWSDCDPRTKEGKVGEYFFISWQRAQARKNDQRQPLTIVDLGTHRLVFREYFPDMIN